MHFPRLAMDFTQKYSNPIKYQGTQLQNLLKTFIKPYGRKICDYYRI
jgi:hypothetical protein